MANVTQNRPLSPHLQIYKPIPTMVMSIIHRITGGALYFGTLLVALVADRGGDRSGLFRPGQLDHGFDHRPARSCSAMHSGRCCTTCSAASAISFGTSDTASTPPSRPGWPRRRSSVRSRLTAHGLDHRHRHPADLIGMILSENRFSLFSSQSSVPRSLAVKDTSHGYAHLWAKSAASVPPRKAPIISGVSA